MRIGFNKPAVAAAVAAALAVVATPVAANAASGDRAPIPLSVVHSKLKSLAVAATPFTIKNQKSSKYLQPVSTSNGANVAQQGASSSSTQGWLLFADGSYITYQNYGVNRDLGTAGAATAAGTHAVIRDGSSSTDLDWIEDPKSDGVHFRLKNRKDSSKCLGIDGASTASGAYAEIFTCDSTTNQTWSYTNF